MPSTRNSGNAEKAQAKLAPLVTFEQITELLQNEEFNSVLYRVVNKVIDKMMPTIKEELSKRLEKCEGDIFDLQDEVKHHKETCATLQSDLSNNHQKINRLENELEDLQQYSRRNNFRIFGAKESPNESPDNIAIDIVRNHLNVDLTASDIDRCHRVGKPSGQSSKPRPIIVKLISHRKKREIFSNKKNLKKQKETNYRIHEDLSVKRYSILLAAQKCDKLQACWTIDGKVFANVPASNNTVVRKLIPNKEFLETL